MIEQGIRELLDVLLRWTHVIAGIMWVGNSLLFNWLDRNLVKREGASERHVGEVWLLHSGGFYEVETSSPSAALAPGASLDHVHATLHVVGTAASLDGLATKVLGVSILALDAAPPPP